MAIETNESRKPPRSDQDGRRGVFGSRKFWFLSAEWSAIAFVTAAGLFAILWAYMTGSDSRLFSFVMRRSSGLPPAAENVLPEALPVSDDRPRHPLDGSLLASVEERQIYAISIDNIGAARPQAGISRASLVYEVPVEGGITRLLAFFASDTEDISRIGPVRSARPYFQDWVDRYGAAYGHVGGSPEALERLRTSATHDLNQYFWGGSYWRDRNRAAPHNVYTSSQLMKKAMETFDQVGTAPEVSQTGMFEEGSVSGDPSGKGISIDWSSPQFFVEWKYDPERNDYVRYQGSRRIADEDGAVVRAQNVVIHFTKVRIIDDVGRRAIDTVGPGRALIARDGRVIEGVWDTHGGKRAASYIDTQGEPILRSSGVTWIEVVPEDTEITY